MILPSPAITRSVLSAYVALVQALERCGWVNIGREDPRPIMLLDGQEIGVPRDCWVDPSALRLLGWQETEPWDYAAPSRRVYAVPPRWAYIEGHGLAYIASAAGDHTVPAWCLRARTRVSVLPPPVQALAERIAREARGCPA